MRFAILTLFLIACCHATSAAADEPKCRSCPHCGCCDIKKICRIVPEIKKEPKPKFTCTCEEICLPGRSRKVGEQTIPDCNSRTGERCVPVYEPTCGRIVVKVKLKKTTETIEKPGFKCVVETVCCQCGKTCGVVPDKQ